MSIDLNQYLYFIVAIVGLIISVTGIRYAKQWPVFIGTIVGYTAAGITRMANYNMSSFAVLGVAIGVGVVVALIFMFLPKLPYMIVSSLVGGLISGLFGYCAIKDYPVAFYIVLVYEVTSDPSYGIPVLYFIKTIVLIMAIVTAIGVIVQSIYYVKHKDDGIEK